MGSKLFIPNDKQPVDPADWDIKEVRPTPEGQTVSMSTGASCRVDKNIEVVYNYYADWAAMALKPEAGHTGTYVTKDLLQVMDNQSGRLYDVPMNVGKPNDVDLGVSYYGETSAWFNRDTEWRNGRIEEYIAGFNQRRGELLNAPKESIPEMKRMTHPEILEQLGINCTKYGFEVAPVFSTDDIRALAKAGDPDLNIEKDKGPSR
ncbi:hypothetical protein KHC28_01500 [Ancylobacter sonchi]|uniref:hypothetical protein n=1 Tax=Ancylobacter sonchi TaxID=1937790 RepID=UPI001BD2D74F|nr:hypothetical protein [Ancylobacter sonchi]MBS7532328.1 hypothetical protein [Ancylobacter sonchi]